MFRPFTLALLAICAGTCSADTPLWVARPEAQPWLPAMTRAADRTGLPVALIAELIGTESGFQNIQNSHSSAAGFGQQIRGNRVMWLYGLNRMKPEDSILGAALEFRQNLDRTGTIARAARSYGTTVGLPATRQRRILARLTLAAGSDAYQLPGQDIRLQPARSLEAVQPRQSLVVAAEVGHGSAGRHQPR